ncbi:MAG TPA: hypothetical protein VKU35_05040 [Candidatus Limnocylindria bacterium]|nr:hypothetical protein [Candidatus Limnocylindria bacterium]
MDELARRYLLLCLRLDRLSPGFIDSYVGPSELKEIALAEPPALATELHDETMALSELADQLPDDGPATTRRRLWFCGQLRAMGALAREAGGEEITYLDLVEQLFDMPIRPVPDAELQAARLRIDEALPGPGSLQERVAAFRATLRVPAERVLGAVQDSADRFRSLARRDFDLPPEESIAWEEAHDQPWGAFAHFLGNGRTRIQINIDLPMEVTLVAFLAAHEAYPGHHADHVVKERTLISDADLGEAMVRTMNSPEAVLAEGLADLGREVVMADWELEAELRRIGREVGVEGDWVAAVEVRNAQNELQAATGNAGIMLHHDGRPEREVRDYLSEVGAVPADRLDHSIRVLRDPVNRTYSFTYSEGKRLIRPWLEAQGQTTGFWRLLSEQLSPAALLADLEAARSPVGDPA